MSEQPAGDAAAIDAPDIRVVEGRPTTEELAAVTAVIAGALEAIAGEQRRSASPGPTAWQRSQRAVRGHLQPGAWVTFGR